MGDQSVDEVGTSSFRDSYISSSSSSSFKFTDSELPLCIIMVRGIYFLRGLPIHSKSIIISTRDEDCRPFLTVIPHSFAGILQSTSELYCGRLSIYARNELCCNLISVCAILVNSIITITINCAQSCRYVNLCKIRKLL